MTTSKMPVFFLAHGSPMNALENNYFTQDWLNIHKGTPAPTAIVVFSAHWHVPGTRVLHDEFPKPSTILAAFRMSYICNNIPAPAHRNWQ
jgi:4,5-DOPA dioxygenase extradiol